MTRIRSYIALALLLAIPATAIAATPTAPKAGRYKGPKPASVILQIAGRSVELAAFSFPCGEASGRTSLNDFPLRRTSKGYRFNADAHGNVTYSDEVPDENGEIHMSGRFSLDGKTVRGHMRVETKRCGVTPNLRWRAAR